MPKSKFGDFLNDAEEAGLVIQGKDVLSAAVLPDDAQQWQGVVTLLARHGSRAGIRLRKSADVHPSDETVQRILESYGFTADQNLVVRGSILPPI